ncbi:MAG: 30S ribosomal protein S8 [Pseudomonadaceae bacterium]|nr:30S ribosomal protein S8 [Pseudomonadaceae bacterium]
MTMTDPIADMFARLKNGLKQHHTHVSMPASSLKKAVLDVLVSEGYLTGWSEEEAATGHKSIKVDLKYYQGKPVITKLSRVSKPGRRVYSASTELPKVANGLGVTIVSTSKGVMTDTKAREINVGGEIIGQVM